MMESEFDIKGLRYVAGVDLQVGVLAWLPASEPFRFVIVTSRRTGRWVLPKGSIDEGMTPSEAAAQEAVEEAGVIGKTATSPVGTYRVPKIRPPFIWSVEVALYPIEVTEILDVWIEAEQRTRRFVTLDEAAPLLEDDGVLDLVKRFAASRSPA